MSDFCEHIYSRVSEDPLADYIELEDGFVHKDCYKAVACQYSDETEIKKHIATELGDGGFVCLDHRDLAAAKVSAEIWRAIRFDEESYS